MTVPDWIPAVTAWLGVAVSFVFSLRAHKSSERANDIQKQMLDVQRSNAARIDEERKIAHLEVKFRDGGVRGGGAIVVRNQGPGTARMIDVTVAKNPKKLTRFAQGYLNLPHDELRPGAILAIDVNVGSKHTSLLTPVDVSWYHEDGSRDTTTTDL